MIVKLEDVCEKAASNVMQKDISDCAGEYKIFGASGYLGNVNFYHQEKPYVAIVKDGAGIGRTFLLPEKSSVIGTMQYLLPKDNVLPEYLYYVVQYMHLEKYFSGATIPHIYFKNYKNETFNLVSIEQQKNVIKNLSENKKIIENRKQQLEQLDLLIKSRFVEMFSDIDLTMCKSEWLQIKEIGRVVSGATPKTTIEEYWTGDFNWFTPAELNNNSGYIFESERKISKKGVDSCSLQKLPANTVLLTSRAPIGKLAIAGIDCYCNQGFKNIICNTKILPRYLYYLLLFNTEFLNSLGRGATFKEISKSIVENIRIPVPSVELQNKFAEFVEQVEKSKSAVQKALDEAQLLFDSLMQEYFG